MTYQEEQEITIKIFNGYPLELLTQEERENKTIALSAVNSDGLKLKYFPKFKNDEEVCKAALLNNTDSIAFIDLSLLFNDDFWLFAFNNYLIKNENEEF